MVVLVMLINDIVLNTFAFFVHIPSFSLIVETKLLKNISKYMPEVYGVLI